LQASTVPDVDSIDIQTEIQWFMRPYLLDFLVEAHSAFQLLPETLFLTVNLLDRYCSKRVVYKRHYQLVGCAALLIAAKYGDKKEKVPTIKELKSMCCSLYDDDMFLQMEWHVLSTLDWSVGHPTVDSFVKLAVKDNIADPETENLTLYILEMALFHRDFVSKQSSTLALAALALARHILGRPQARTNEYASRYCETTLVQLSQKLHQPSEILSRKYASGRYSAVSRVLCMFLAEQAAIAAANTALEAPPSPPCEYAPASKPVHVEQYGYSTPQKPQFQSTVQHGYPTPPITPEEEYFGKDPRNHAAPHRYAPFTPTPTAFTSQCSGFDCQVGYGTAPPAWPAEPYHPTRRVCIS
jgi:Cyclin, N-terminal domain/Cyclin, C-terminal domain